MVKSNKSDVTKQTGGSKKTTPERQTVVEVVAKSPAKDDETVLIPEPTITDESPSLTIVSLAVERQFLGLSVRDHDILIQQVIQRQQKKKKKSQIVPQ